MRASKRRLCLVLILIFVCLAEPVKASESTDTLIGHRYYFSIDTKTGYYTACHDGIAVGSVPGKFTQNEEGYFENVTDGYGWMTFVLTTKNGEILHIELGTRDNPYVWKVSGSWFAFHRTITRGPVYVEGKYVGMYNTISFAFGKTWIMKDFPVE